MGYHSGIGGQNLMPARRLLLPVLLLVLVTAGLGAQRAEPVAPGGAVAAADLREWLGYIASDELQGRQVYSEGLGLAASYIADRLREWGVKPAGDDGSYFQTVRVQGMKTESRASVTVEVGDRSRTFKDGEGIIFPRNMGGKQTVTGNRIYFAGYGLQIPDAEMDDYDGVDPKGHVVVYMSQAPSGLPPGSGRLLAARARSALEKGAVAAIGPVQAFGGGRGGGRGAAAPSAAGAAQQVTPDFTTVQRYDDPLPPALTAQDEFFDLLFSASEVPYAEIKARAAKGEPLPRFALAGARLTINVDADYTVVRTRLTRNVVGIVEGTDPKLKDTYVVLGAHYDHTGYRETGPPAGGGNDPGGCEGQTRPQPRPDDIIFNGADDDGSGTVTVMGVARAFAQGQKPRRSLLFVWFTAEESGLQGSRFKADYPVVPNENIVAMLNADMVGRNRCDRESEANTVYLVGSDRISTELHNLSEDANAALPRPMTLDYEFNDPADPQSLYTRSDHYSYAAKGIPVIFYTTGLHKDYHWVTDEVDLIEFEKMARIGQLIHHTMMDVANQDRPPARDNQGPRAGKGSSGKLGAR
jgi:hypothetical protein